MRLNPLAFLLSQTPLSPPPPSSPNASPPTVDVAIVGAGLSGLSAAHHLLRADLSVTILEARDRVGGKVHNRSLNISSDAVTELGAAFVGPTQDNVLQTLSRLNLSIFPQHLSGKSITISSGERIVFSPPSESGPNDGLSGLGPETDSALAQTLGVIDDLASTLDPSAPWLHSSSHAWDKLSISAWLTSSALLLPGTPGRAFFETVIETIFSASTHELSLLYLLTYSSSAGNLISKGTFTRIVGTAGGAQESRVEGGTGRIPLALAEEVKSQGGKIELSSPVRSVVLDSEKGVYTLLGDDGKPLVRAKHVVVAMSPPLAARIRYAPPLTAARDQLSQRMFMGSIGKAIAVYDTPFWREENLSGQVISDEGTVRVTFDASPADGRYGAILGFLEADEARDVDGLSDEEVRRRVGEDYVKYFGPGAADVKEWVIMRWDTEEFSRGGPVAVPGLGTMSEYGHALRERVGQIYWAGTETATHWMGYMSGALESGERVATEILRNRLMGKEDLKR